MIRREEEKHFQSSKIWWVCEKLIDDDNVNVRDHCHLTNKFIGAAHWSCNMNSSLDKLVKNLSDNDIKYLTEEFGSKNLELLKKKKMLIRMSTWTVFKDLVKKNCLIENVFITL